MAYCTLTDLYSAGIHQGVAFDTTSQPTATQAQGHIDQVYQEINGILDGLGVSTLPVSSVTSPNAYSTLRRLNVVGAGYRCEQAAYQFVGEHKESQFVKDLRDEYEKSKAVIMKNPSMYLSDAVQSRTTPWSFVSSNYDTSLDYEESKPLFRVDDNWWGA